MKKYLCCVIILFLYSCMVGPNYTPPENHVIDTWTTDTPKISTDPVLTKWWEVFKDPLLDKYICLAVENNNNVLVAMSNILQARALRKIAASSFFPQINADVNATRTYFSKNGPVFEIGVGDGSVTDTPGLPFSLQVPQTQNLYNIFFDASWEIDLFGKTRRTVEAANAVIGRTIEEKNDTLISVMAEVARNYMELRGGQEKVKLIKENISLLEEQSYLIRKQLEAGYINRLDLEEILALLFEEKAKLPNIEAQIYKNIYTLSVLVGDVPETLVQELQVCKPLPKIPEKVAIGLRSDLLRRRPDIRRSERDLAEATANIGVAVASFFPSFTLLGGGGLQSLMIKNLFSLGSRAWAFGGDINMPIFQGGKLIGNLQAKKAKMAAVAYNYQETVLQALQETESMLVSYTKDLESIKEKEESMGKYQQLVLLGKQRYIKGLTNLLDFINTKKRLNESEQSYLETNIITLVDLISLYKALGGGWKIEYLDQ